MPPPAAPARVISLGGDLKPILRKPRRCIDRKVGELPDNRSGAREAGLPPASIRGRLWTFLLLVPFFTSAPQMRHMPGPSARKQGPASVRQVPHTISRRASSAPDTIAYPISPCIAAKHLPGIPAACAWRWAINVVQDGDVMSPSGSNTLKQRHALLLPPACTPARNRLRTRAVTARPRPVQTVARGPKNGHLGQTCPPSG